MSNSPDLLGTTEENIIVPNSHEAPVFSATLMAFVGGILVDERYINTIGEIPHGVETKLGWPEGTITTVGMAIGALATYASSTGPIIAERVREYFKNK
jgi:hypothetical protein